MKLHLEQITIKSYVTHITKKDVRITRGGSSVENTDANAYEKFTFSNDHLCQRA